MALHISFSLTIFSASKNILQQKTTKYKYPPIADSILLMVVYAYMRCTTMKNYISLLILVLSTIITYTTVYANNSDDKSLDNYNSDDYNEDEYEPIEETYLYEKDVPTTEFDKNITIHNFITQWFANNSCTNMTALTYPSEDISVGIISKLTNDTIFCGRSSNDFISVNNKHFKYVEGRNGADVYKITYQSPKYLWINNYATDNVVDVVEMKTWAILNCNDNYNSSIIQKTAFDVVLCYSHHPFKIITKYMVLLNYLKDDSYMHLIFKIICPGCVVEASCSMVVPEKWLLPSISNSGYRVNYANKVYSLKHNCYASIQKQYWAQYGGFPILHVYDEQCTFFLRNSTDERLAVDLYVNDGRGNSNIMLMTLMQFYGENGSTISNAWSAKYFIILYDNVPKPKRLFVNELLSSRLHN